MKLPIGLMATAIVAGTLTEAIPPRPCTHEEFCPEPEQAPPDMKEHGRPTGPTGPGVTTNATSGPTGPTGSAAILEGADIASGSGNITPNTGALNFASSGPQVYEDIQPRIFPSA